MADSLEIEVKFLEIDVPAVQTKLAAVGAENLGEDLLEEVIFYDKDLVWVKERDQYNRFVRLRRNRKGVFLTYKNLPAGQDYATELETVVGDLEAMKTVLENVGLVAARYQQKKRHSYKLDGVAVDVDTWPQIPSYIELEGPDEAAIKAVAQKLGFDWSQGVFDTASGVISKQYHLNVWDLKYFTFDKVE